ECRDERLDARVRAARRILGENARRRFGGERLERAGERARDAIERAGPCGARLREEHGQDVGAARAAGPLDEDLGAERAGVPGELEVREPVAAADERAPLVERERRISAEALARRVDVEDRSEQRLD